MQTVPFQVTGKVFYTFFPIFTASILSCTDAIAQPPPCLHVPSPVHFRKFCLCPPGGLYCAYSSPPCIQTTSVPALLTQWNPNSFRLFSQVLANLTMTWLNWKTGVAVLTLNPGKSFASLNLSFLCHEVSITIPGPQQRHCGPNLHVQSTRRPSHIKHALGLDDVTPVIFLYSISQNIFFCLFQKYITALLTLIPPNGFMFLSFFFFYFSWVFPLKSK